MKKSKLLLGLMSLLAITAVSSCAVVPSSSSEQDSSSSMQEPSSEVSSTPSSEVPPQSEEPPHVDVDKEKADEVIQLIETLTSESTEEEIQAVIDAYNDLTPRQQSFVTNYDKLADYILKLEKINAVKKVDAMIEALNEESLVLSEVQAARDAYNDLAIDYGLEWQAKVKAENVAKLERCEIKIARDAVNPIIAKALDIDTSENKGKTQFKLLSRRIEDFLEGTSQHVQDAIENFDEYHAIYEVVERTHTIAVENYINSTHCLPDEKKWAPMTIVEDEDFGYLSTEDLSMYGDIFAGSGNIQFATEVMTDFSKYKSIAFFASWPYVSTGLQFINDEVTAISVTVPAENEFVYVEIPVSNLGDKTGTNHSHIGAYLTDRALGALDGYKITAIVGIGIDEIKAQEAVDAVDAMIEALDEDNLTVEAVQAAREAYDQLAIDYSTEWQAKVKAENVAKLKRCEIAVRAVFVNDLIAEAAEIEFNSRQNAARFTLLSNTIAAKYAELGDDEKALVNLDEHNAKAIELDGKVGILFGNGYKHNDTIYNKVDDNNFGTMNTISWSAPMTENMVLDFNHENKLIGVDWSNYEHMGMFVRYDQSVTDTTCFIPNGDWDEGDYIRPTDILVDEATNLHYYEFDLSIIDSAFFAHTYFQVFFGAGEISKYEATNLVFFNEFNPEDPDIPDDPVDPTVESLYNVSHHGDYDWIWDDTNIVASKDDATGITNHTFTFANTTEAFFQTVDTTSTVEEDTTYVVTVANNTDKTISVTSTSRTWNSVEGTFNITLEVGQTAQLLISSYVWNNTERPDENKGYAVRIYSNGETFTGDVSVTSATLFEGEIPEVITPAFGYIEAYQYGNPSNPCVVNEEKDETYGNVYCFTASFNTEIYFRETTIPEGDYDYVVLDIYSSHTGTIKDAKVIAGNWSTKEDLFNIESGWNKIYVDINHWAAGSLLIYDLFDREGGNEITFKFAVTGFATEADLPSEPETPVEPSEPEVPVESLYNVSHHGDYDWLWDDTTGITTTKDKETGLIYHAKTFTNTTEAFFQTVDTSTPVEEGATYEVVVKNNTEQTLNFSSTSRTWDASQETYVITVEAGQTAKLKISAYCWNVGSKNGSPLYGYAIRVTNAAGGTFSGEAIISSARLALDEPEIPVEPSEPEVPTVVESSYNVSHHGSYDWLWDDTNVNTTKDNETGLVYHSKTFTDTTEAFFQTVDTTTRIGDNDVYQVVVKNNTNVALTFISTSRSWDAQEQTYSVTVEAGQTATLQISVYCWNNSTNGLSGYAIRVTNANGGTFSGEVVISNAYLVEQPTSLFGSITIPEVYKKY